MIHPHATFKTAEIERRCRFLCEEVSHVAYEMAEWCEERKLPFQVTDSVSTAAEDKALDRVSDEHRQARAFDISIRLWPDSQIKDFMSHFEDRFSDIAAIGKATGKPRLIFRHNVGHGDHLHVQVARQFAVRTPGNRDIV